MNTLLVAIGKYGLGTVLAGFLVWQLASRLPVIEAQHVTILGNEDTMQQSLSDIVQGNKEAAANSQRIMRSICLILASSQKEIQTCNQ